MGHGAITQYVDLAQLVLYAFWIFFAGLIYYLIRENHREGYPMETETGRGTLAGWPVPQPKTYLLAHGGEFSVPNDIRSPQVLAAEPSHRWAGAPLVPTGNPMLDGVGPGAWADRADVPDLDYLGRAKIVPLRTLPGFGVERGDVDPRGLDLIGADDQVAGKVVDLWMDTAESLFRYLEIELEGSQRRVMVPMNFARVRRGHVKVSAILAHQFAAVPGTRQTEVITLLEEEKIMAYYGGGTLYAEPSRGEPLL
jgi:photosynthetic reaction center H subunit